MGGGLLAGKPKPTSGPLPRPLFPPASSPQSRGTPDASGGEGLHHLHRSELWKDSAPRSRPGTRSFASTGSTGHPTRFLSLNAT